MAHPQQSPKKRPTSQPPQVAPTPAADKAQPPVPLANAVQSAKLDPGTLTPGNVLQLQRTLGNQAVRQLLPHLQRDPAPATAPEPGLPADLRAGVEDLSGLAMDDVQVHYNSGEPAALQALAFTEGTTIHVAPGQERELPHEAWHVVQQKQGKVTPTLQTQRFGINLDARLEQEAEAMGTRASQLGLAARLPTPAQVQASAQQLGQPVQRQLVGAPVRQFKCGGKKNRNRPQIVEQPDINSLEGIAARISEKSGREFTVETLRDIWENGAPDPSTDRLWNDYGVDIQNQFPEIFMGGLTALVPPEITAGVEGTEAAKLSTIFQRINHYAFTYTGGHNQPEVGFMNKAGDCQTLGEMFQLAARAIGIDVGPLATDQVPHLVAARPAHGRVGNSNEANGRYWAFDTHFWCAYQGTKYDLLFMTSDNFPVYHKTGEGAYQGCTYAIHEGGRYFIARDEAQSKLNEELPGQGIAFNSLEELHQYVDVALQD